MTYILLLKLIELLVLKWIYVYDEAGSDDNNVSVIWDKKEAELYVEDEIDSW